MGGVLVGDGALNVPRQDFALVCGYKQTTAVPYKNAKKSRKKPIAGKVCTNSS